jgi:hypothetical protein
MIHGDEINLNLKSKNLEENSLKILESIKATYLRP